MILTLNDVLIYASSNPDLDSHRNHKIAKQPPIVSTVYTNTHDLSLDPHLTDDADVVAVPEGAVPDRQSVRDRI